MDIMIKALGDGYFGVTNAGGINSVKTFHFMDSVKVDFVRLSAGPYATIKAIRASQIEDLKAKAQAEDLVALMFREARVQGLVA